MRKLTSGKRFATRPMSDAGRMLVATSARTAVPCGWRCCGCRGLRAFSMNAMPDVVVEEEAFAVRARTAYTSSTRRCRTSASSSMPSRSPGWFGFTRPCSSRRCVPCIRLDDVARRLGLLDGERLALARRRHERQHHHVGVGIQEHVLDEFVGAEATQVTARCRAHRRACTCLWARS